MTDQGPHEWTENDLHYVEVQRYPYKGTYISTGFVEGHPVDTMYLLFEREGRPDDRVLLLLRPDEVSALAWCLLGVINSRDMSAIIEQKFGEV